MPNRILREGILTSERVNALSWPAEVFYRRLMSAVDDFGRFWAKPDLLRAALYPLQLEKVGNSNVAKWLAECAGAGLVRAYTVEKKEYLQLLDFRQQVRAKDSKFPQPPDDCLADATQTPSASIAHAHVVGDVVGDEDEGERARKRARKHSIPEGFEVSERVKKWAASEGFTRLAEHLEVFKRKCAAHGYMYSDWDAAFMEAIRKDWAQIREGNGSTKPWYLSASGIEAKGREFGWEPPTDKREWASWKAEVYERAGITEEMVKQARTDFGNPS